MRFESAMGNELPLRTSYKHSLYLSSGWEIYRSGPCGNLGPKYWERELAMIIFLELTASRNKEE